MSHYLVFNKNADASHTDLTKAIDGYVEKLTRDRTTLRRQHHNIDRQETR